MLPSSELLFTKYVFCQLSVATNDHVTKASWQKPRRLLIFFRDVARKNRAENYLLTALIWSDKHRQHATSCSSPTFFHCKQKSRRELRQQSAPHFQKTILAVVPGDFGNAQVWTDQCFSAASRGKSRRRTWGILYPQEYPGEEVSALFGD